MSTRPIDPTRNRKQRDPDLTAAEIAIKRAAQEARKRARQAGGGIFVWKNGQIVEEREEQDSL